MLGMNKELLCKQFFLYFSEGQDTLLSALQAILEF